MGNIVAGIDLIRRGKIAEREEKGEEVKEEDEDVYGLTIPL